MLRVIATAIIIKKGQASKAKIMKRLHSIFSESISNELVWSDIIATSFYEFFDINRYIDSLEI
jgi:hypothetical protein